MYEKIREKFMNTIPVINFNSGYNTKYNAPAFGGKVGNRLISESMRGIKLDTDSVMKELKGPVWLREEKTRDVIESFINYINHNSAERRSLINENQSLRQKISNLKRTFGRVKPVDDINYISPTKVLNIMREMSENNIASRKSLYDFLTTAQGQEEALKQIARNAIIYKTSKDTSMKLMMEKVADELSFVDTREPVKFVMNFLTETLSAAPDKNILFTPASREQIRINAKALFDSVVDKRDSKSLNKPFGELLDGAIDKATERITAVDKARKYLAKELISDNPVLFDFDKSFITVQNSVGFKKDISYPILTAAMTHSSDKNTVCYLEQLLK
jgi:hypothetical protein